MERRAVVQGDTHASMRPGNPHREEWARKAGRQPMPPGTVSWAEHEEAWEAYAGQFGRQQSAERMHKRGGFGYGELVMFLGHAPTTWAPRERAS